MAKLIEIFKIVLTCGWYAWSKYRDNKKQLETVILSTKDLLDYVRTQVNDYKNGRISNLANNINPDDLKLILKESQKRLGGQERIAETLANLIKTKS